MLGNRLPERGFEDERNVRRFLYSPLDLCMLEEQGVEEGLEDSIVWGSRPLRPARYCPDGRHPKRNPALLLTPPRESRTFKGGRRGSADK